MRIGTAWFFGILIASSSSWANPIKYAVPTISDLKQIASGPDYVCQLDYHGKVKCAAEGSVINPIIELPVPNNLPFIVKIFVLSGISNPHMAFDTVCAADLVGGSTCWGYDTTTISDPDRPGDYRSFTLADPNRWYQLPSGLSNVRQIVSGGSYSCALDDHGVKCWGTDPYNWGETAVPAGLVNIKQILVNSFSTCAMSDRDITCWGKSWTQGGAGVPTTSPPPIPQGLVKPSQMTASSVIKENFSWDDLCALDEGKIKCQTSAGGPGAVEFDAPLNTKQILLTGWVVTALDSQGEVTHFSLRTGQVPDCFGSIDPAFAKITSLVERDVKSSFGANQWAVLDNSTIVPYGSCNAYFDR